MSQVTLLTASATSPKAGADWKQRSGNQLKAIWPQPGIDLDQLEQAGFEHRFLQPMDRSERHANTQCASTNASPAPVGS